MYFEIDYVTQSGCDWVTQTAVNPEDSYKIVSWANHFVNQGYCGDLECIPWKAGGYHGYQRAGVKAGVRQPDEAIVVISGDLANRAVKRLPLGSTRVTRIDLQVTLKLKRENPSVAREIYDSGEQLYSGNGVPPYTKLIRSPGGDTVYVGKRTSPICTRVYDASHKYPGSLLGSHWRVEVEYKRNHAQECYRRLHLDGDPGSFALRQVCAEVQKRNIPLPKFSGTVINAIASKTTITTPEQKLEWLRKTVAPCVANLIGLGYESTVREALGLRELTYALREEKKQWR